MNNLADKIVLITAGASGIGLVIAKTFVAAGAKVIICDINKNLLDKAKQELKDIFVTEADVSDPEDVKNMFDLITSEFGCLDVLVNNAGVSGPTGRVDQLDTAEWKKTLDINIFGQFLCVKYGLPLLLKSNNASIVNMSSIAGHMGVAGRTPYVASKWAVVGFTKSLALELGADGIRVNCVLPGLVSGKRIDKVIADKATMHGKSIEEMTELYTRGIALKRMVGPEDIANMVLFLSTDAAKNIHGQKMVVDGYTESVY